MPLFVVWIQNFLLFSMFTLPVCILTLYICIEHEAP